MKSFGLAVKRFGLACAVVSLSTVSAFATEPPNPLEEYTAAADIEGLINNGGLMLGSVVTVAITVALAFKVIRIGLRWFRG